MATNKKTPKAIYLAFFEKFKRKPGYIGSLLNNNAGEKLFEIHFDFKKDVDEAKEYLKLNGIKYSIGAIDNKRLLIKP